MLRFQVIKDVSSLECNEALDVKQLAYQHNDDDYRIGFEFNERQLMRLYNNDESDFVTFINEAIKKEIVKIITWA